MVWWWECGGGGEAVVMRGCFGVFFFFKMPRFQFAVKCGSVGNRIDTYLMDYIKTRNICNTLKKHGIVHN